MKISVMIVVQNGERYLSTAIESVLNQSHRPHEVFVVDGNSSDRTAQIAQSYPTVCYLQQSGKGLANARNTGIAAASGELLAFLDHDDYWTPNKLKVQSECFLNAAEIQYSYAKVKLFLETGCRLRAGFSQQQLNTPQIGRTPGTLMARKILFDRIGQFNPRFSIGCDVEWFTRAKDHQIPAALVPEVLLYKRVHHTNLSSNVQTNRSEVLTVIKQSLDRQREYSLNA